MNFLVPQGIGDAVWALLKIEDVNRKMDGGPINVRIACFHDNEVEKRALEFMRQFEFVNSAEMYKSPRINQSGPSLMPGEPSDKDGYYRYVPDGRAMIGLLPRIDYVLMPNHPLERGIRLENWLPQFETNWRIMDSFRFKSEDVTLADSLIPERFAVFFCGSLAGNTTDGHNRGPIWKPEDWVRLGEEMRSKYGLDIVIVGADYDREYYEQKIIPLLTVPWTNLIGKLSIGATFAVTRKAKFVISYQSGIGIVSSYLGVPVAIFWRRKTDSVSSTRYISFDETMASAWAPPEMINMGKHLPLVYARHDVAYITNEIETRKWAS